eukprot:TRINITY_DN5430_c0_g1_i4.p1 TRINITY_DN5430_c0_g1~~TRINITY_DN5430_c0_g1_i4.p1  ORF type:complete len:369 (+),score=15.23 TRINITY_DN5430_c0_g1_i4:97-1203(+)
MFLSVCFSLSHILVDTLRADSCERHQLIPHEKNCELIKGWFKWVLEGIPDNLFKQKRSNMLQDYFILYVWAYLNGILCYNNETYNFSFEEANMTTTVETLIYSPEQSDRNGHLIMIVNGAQVHAAEYSTLCQRLATRGYHVLVADYLVSRQEEFPFLNNTGKPPMTAVPNVRVLVAILHSLVDGNNQTDLPRLQFNNVILLGHSLGGIVSLLSMLDYIPDIVFRFGDRSEELVTRFGLPLPDSIWSEYVKGSVLYEGWSAESLPVPENKFLVLMVSDYEYDYMQRLVGYCGEECEVGFHIFENANHYLVTNYYDEKQVTPFARPASGQDDFVTTYDQWEEGQELLAFIVDSEIRSRLDNEENQFVMLG